MDLKTVTQIADALDERPERMRYIVNKLRLKPEGRAGLVRLFNPDQARRIKTALYNMQIRN